jgi:hypothetical protein
MQISAKAWNNYIAKMSCISSTAAQKMLSYIANNGFDDMQAILDYAFALSTRYGKAIGALACQMYDATAAAQGADVPAAEMAELPEYGEVAKTVYGAKKKSESEVSRAIGRLVKRTGADTTLKNAERDGAQFAWVPHGDTCAFCITLASRGWQYMSKNALKNGHAEHIHAHCDCQYAVRFDNASGVKGYDPDKYREMYDNAEGTTPEEKINSLRRMAYAKNQKSEKGHNLAALIGGDIVPKHEEPRLIASIDLSDKTQIQSVLDNFEKEFSDAPTENAIVITKTGEVFHCFGTETNVYPKYDLENKIDGATISHNHPLNVTQYTFSDEDVDFFIDNNLEELYGEDIKYKYRISKSDTYIDELPTDWTNEENFEHSKMIINAQSRGFGYRRWRK